MWNQTGEIRGSPPVIMEKVYEKVDAEAKKRWKANKVAKTQAAGKK
jgi:hypothetical protein